MGRVGLGAMLLTVLWSHAAAGQLSQQGAKLVGADAVGPAWQGSAVAVSADGSTAIVGGYLDNGGAGAAWIFTRGAGDWTQQGGKLVGSGASGNAEQGWSVAISGDGNTALVGGPADNKGVGAVWVFARSGGVWSQQGGKLVGSGGSGHPGQGFSVALSSDGNTAIVGAPHDANDMGAAWVFARAAGSWKQQGGKVVGTGAVGSPMQGSSVALSGDAGTAAIGGPQDNDAMGAAWIFVRQTGSWTQQGGKLVGVAPDTTFTISAGASVTALFTQQPPPCDTLAARASPRIGGTVRVNTAQNCSGGYTPGTEVSVTVVPETDWAFAGWSGSGVSYAGSPSLTSTFTITGNAELTANLVEESSTCFPFSVAVNPPGAGGATVLTAENCTNGFTGGALISLAATPTPGWTFSGWTGSGGLLATPGAPITFFAITGVATATANFAQTSAACESLAVSASPGAGGGVSVNTAKNCSGGFTQGTPISLTANPAPGWVFSGWSGSGGSFSGVVGVVPRGLQGSSVAISGDGDTVALGGSLDAYPAGAIWVFARSGTTWLQQGNPIATTGQASLAAQQWSVSVSGDGTAILAAEPGDDGGRGAAWLFGRAGSAWVQQGTALVGTGAAGEAEQGFAAALSGDGTTAIVGGPNDGGGTGAAWVFTVGGTSSGCSFTLSSTTQGFPAGGGAGAVAVNTTTTGSCPWVAVSNASWITVTGTGEGSGSGLVTLGVAANGGFARLGTVTIAGQTLTVYQAGSNCSYVLDPTSASVPVAGGGGSFAVSAAAGCPWSASSTASWLRVTGAGAGLGNGTVGFVVDANAGGARSAAIAVADLAFAVTQDAYVPPLHSAFAATPSRPVVGALVTFTDASAGVPTSWSWSFGDGASSTAQDPIHAYSAPGTYTVTLAVANATATSSASQQLVVVTGNAAWLSVVSHGGGVGGSEWRSDVALLNPGSVPASVEGLFHGPGGVVAGSVLVPVGGQVVVRDVVSQLGSQGSGALEVLSDQPVVVSSRTYDALADGTVGQGYAASSSAAGLGVGESAWLPQLVEDAAYRTNISITNTGTEPAAVTVTLLDGAGSVLASYDVTLAPGELVQDDRPFFARAGQTGMSQGYAEVSVTSGGGVIAAASVIDNVTNDPTPVAMAPAGRIIAGSVWLSVVSHGGGVGGSEWRSDVALLNPGSVPASVEGLFHGPGGVVAGSVLVPAGGQVVVRDVVSQLGSQGSGALEVLSDQPVVVSSRTYDALADGTVGQGYAASSSAAGLGVGESAWLPQLVEDAAYRTNISITNTGTEPAAVTVTLLDGAGSVLASYDVTLAPGELVQDDRPFFARAGQTGMSQGYAEVSVTSGGGVIAAASVIDNVTNDPTTVVMVRRPSPAGS